MLTPLADHASMQGECLSSDLPALLEWRRSNNMYNGDPGVFFGGPSSDFLPYYWPEVGDQYADLHNYFEASRVDPREEVEYINVIFTDNDDIDVVPPTTDMGSLMDVENRGALDDVEEGDPRGNPKTSDAEWFSKEPTCDFGDCIVHRQMVITRAALAHTRLGGKMKFFVSGGNKA